MMTQLQIGEFLRTLKNPRYAEYNGDGSIVLDGTYNGMTLQFIASPNDAMDYGRNIYKRAIDGDFGPIKEFDPENAVFKVNTPKEPVTLDLFAEKKE
jgi:hypothetical protein